MWPFHVDSGITSTLPLLILDSSSSTKCLSSSSFIHQWFFFWGGWYISQAENKQTISMQTAFSNKLCGDNDGCYLAIWLTTYTNSLFHTHCSTDLLQKILRQMNSCTTHHKSGFPKFLFAEVTARAWLKIVNHRRQWAYRTCNSCCVSNTAVCNWEHSTKIDFARHTAVHCSLAHISLLVVRKHLCYCHQLLDEWLYNQHTMTVSKDLLNESVFIVVLTAETQSYHICIYKSHTVFCHQKCKKNVIHCFLKDTYFTFVAVYH